MKKKPSLDENRILVHTCCAACASHVFSDLTSEGLEIVALFYNPEVHGRAEYNRRLVDIKKLCKSMDIKLIVPDYDIQEFYTPLMPYQDKMSIKYINDKKRYRRKRCKLCISLLLNRTAFEAMSLKIEKFTSTFLCSPYKDHNEIWETGVEISSKGKLEFYYKDFRKGFWKGRNYARNHNISIPMYCGCSESLEEGRLE